MSSRTFFYAHAVPALTPRQKNFPDRLVPVLLGHRLFDRTAVEVPEPRFGRTTMISYFTVALIGSIHWGAADCTLDASGCGRDLPRGFM